MTVRVKYTDGSSEDFREGREIESDEYLENFIKVMDKDDEAVAYVNSSLVKSISVD